MALFLIAFSLTLLDLVLLPFKNVVVAFLIVTLGVILICKKYKALIALCCGIIFGLTRFAYFKLPQHYQPDMNQPAMVGVVTSIPGYTNHALRLLFYSPKSKVTLRLLWYGKHPYVQVRDRWLFYLRFSKHPRPKPWLLHSGISAQAYVTGGQLVAREGPTQSIAVFRQKLGNFIFHSIKSHELASILIALTTGSRSKLQHDVWQIFQNTGTSHLIAISGLHVGLASGLFYFLIKILWRQSSHLLLCCPAQQAATLLSLLVAWLYTLLAGCALPAERALIMLVVVLYGKISYRQTPLWYRLLLAFSLLILWQPLSLHAVSFWLSFIAVALLAYIVRARSGLIAWLKIQFAMTVGLFPVSLFFFQKVSMVSFAANLIAIPYTSFILVPACLFAGLTFFLPCFFSVFVWQCVAKMLLPLWWYLSKVSSLPFAVWWHRGLTFDKLVTLMIAVVLLLAPKGIPGRWLGFVLIAVIFVR